MLHYGESSNLKKIALQVIATRSSSDEIFELRQLFREYDKSCDGSLSYSDFKDCLSQLNFTDAELKAMFSQVVRIIQIVVCDRRVNLKFLHLTGSEPYRADTLLRVSCMHFGSAGQHFATKDCGCIQSI